MAVLGRIFYGALGAAVVGFAAVRNLLRPKLADGKPPLRRQNAYRHLPGVAREVPPHPGVAGGAPSKPEDKCVGGAPSKPEDKCVKPGAFGLEMLSALAQAGENVFASPLSLATGLLMAEAGATDDSPAAEALKNAVGGLDVKVAGVASANAVFTRNGIKEAFVQALAEGFGARAAALPDSAAPINAWVSEKTEGLIDELVGDDIVKDPLTKALLLNAVYFKGSWASKFDKDASGPGTFRAPAGDMTVMMMTQEASFALSKVPGVGQIVALPYDKDDLRMLLVLPEGEGLAGARAAARALPAAWATARPTREQKAEVVLPRFKVDSGAMEVLPVLIERFPGLKAIRDEDGGFLKMSDYPDLHVSNVIHRAVVAVDEEGTEAAAATAVVMKTRSIPRPPPRVVFDRPFLFLVEHEPTGRVLFAGQLAAPPAADPDLPPPYPEVSKLKV